MSVEDNPGEHDNGPVRVDQSLLPSTWELLHEYMGKHPDATNWAIASFYLQLSRYSERLARGDFKNLMLPRNEVDALQARRIRPMTKTGQGHK